MAEAKRYVLGEGYGLGKCRLSDGPHAGSFAWVGLSDGADRATAVPLRFPHVEPLEDGHVKHPETRRKLRLVLEVIDGPEDEPQEGGGIGKGGEVPLP